MSNESKVLKIVVVGHVDHGKSTVIGRLLYDTNSLPEGAINKVKRIAKETGKPFEYAYLLDAFEEEQKQGITIDITQIQFNTNKREYVIIDAPGHKEFLKNMISGAANAEAAILVIDAKQGVQEQSKRHAYLLSLLGIKKVYVVVNKMDLVNYSEIAFNKVKADIKKFLEELNVHPIDYIPISAFYGENIINNSTQMTWYKGNNFINAIDAIEDVTGLEDKPLRFPIQDVYKFDDRRIIAGKIESGTLKVGDSITIYPEGKNTVVKSIEYWAERDKKDILLPGESVGITVADEFFNKRGELIVLENDKPHVSNRFRANIFWMGKENLVKNKKYKIKLSTQETEGELESIERVIDASSLDTNKKINEIALNDVAEVIIKTKDLLAFDKFNEIQTTGRFVIVDGYDVAGGGIITDEEEISTKVETTGFKYKNLFARGDLFDEFFYDINGFTLIKENYNKNIYTIGDVVPLKGESYEYPKSFDILVFRDYVSISIRNGVVESITNLSEYTYSDYPIVNGRGFAIKKAEDLSKIIEEYKKIQYISDAEKLYYYNKYFDITKYRTLGLSTKII